MRYAFLFLAVLAAVSWYADQHRKATYHRRRYTRARCHALPTRTHRARLALQRLASLRIRITFRTNARTA